MKITQLYAYPVKSLRGIPLQEATLCAQGIKYDRRYILLKVTQDGGFTNMWVGAMPEMAVFHCENKSSSKFTVRYHVPDPPIAPPTKSQLQPIDIPFEPEYANLRRIQITLHKSPTYPAYSMPDEYNTWFSECFGYKVILAYLGDGVGVKREDEIAASWIQTMGAVVPDQVNAISFSDGAALLVASEASLEALHPLLPDGEYVRLEKFRPNIVLDGTTAWDEDFWAELSVQPHGLQLILTSNCARCISLNVDLDKGRIGSDESGKLLKKLMKDRRVDKGKKWEPIFGRYGFPTGAGKVSVGDEVLVTKRNQERTVWNGIVPRLSSFKAVEGESSG